MADATVKGTSLNLTIDLVRRIAGDDGVDRLIAALPEDVQARVPPERSFLPAQTWPLDIWGELLLAAEKLFGSDVLRTSAREGYAHLLATTYRIWVRAGDPVGSLRGMPHLWDQVTQGMGDYEFVETEDEMFMRVRLHGVPERYRGVSEERAAGTIEAMIAASGASGTVERRVVEGGAELVVHLA